MIIVITANSNHDFFRTDVIARRMLVVRVVTGAKITSTNSTSTTQMDVSLAIAHQWGQ